MVTITLFIDGSWKIMSRSGNLGHYLLHRTPLTSCACSKRRSPSEIIEREAPWGSGILPQSSRRSGEMNLASPFSSGSNSVIQKNVVRHGLLGSEPLKLFWLRSPVACFD